MRLAFYELLYPIFFHLVLCEVLEGVVVEFNGLR